MAEEVKPKKGLGKKAKRNIRRAVIALAVIGIGGAVVHQRMEASRRAAMASTAVTTGTAWLSLIAPRTWREGYLLDHLSGIERHDHRGKF